MMQNSILDWVENSAARFPDKTAVVDEEGSVTYAEFRNMSLAVARKIMEINDSESALCGAYGLNKKVPVAVFLKKSKEAVISFIGSAYSGSFYTPIDTDMPASRVEKILGTLKPEIVITSRELKSRIDDFNYSARLVIYENIVSKTDDWGVVLPVTEKIIDTDILYVLFTSGSTGTPKGVAISHRSVIDYIDWVTDTFKITEDDSFGNQAPFYFDKSILDIYSCIKTGAALYIIPKKLFFQPVPLLEYIKENRISSIFWVPSAMMIISRLKAFKNVDVSNTLKRVLFGGEVMPNKQLNIWRKYIPDAVYANFYGPTEITDACTCYIIDREFSDDEPLPIGKVIKNTEVLVLNENDEPAKEGEVGELCVRGTSLSLGYYNNPGRTREVFVQNPLNKAYPELIYRTGDLVKYNEYGEIMYLSRKDFQIKHMGHRIELGEIETAASSLKEITQCCCLYDEKRQKIVLFIDADLDRRSIEDKLSGLVPEYMMPGKVVYLEKLPMNANGKIDRVRLKDLI